MGKIVVGEFVTLDGIIEAPEKWTFPYFSEETQQVLGESMSRSDALLLGRVTYETFEASFSTQTGGMANYLNNVPKYVVSTTLKTAEWNNSTLINGNVAEQIAALKQRHNKDIIINGSGKLIQTLIQHDLIDEYSLLVYPVVLGGGQRLFEAGSQTSLKLIGSRAFSTGVVHLSYIADRKA
jgi:dihydrofolate reductase